ncbi:MAG: LacI family DNA-binding transcriptional regulator [Treponema sp.]|nr:LacI family DNA-binding transcriptional regulator [Treponema sp.]
MITLKELSVKCGVSIATISNVINGKSNVSEKTKEIVNAAIKETGYQPNFMASSLRSQKTKTIGLLIEEMNLFSSPKLVEGIMSYLESQNYRCIIENLRLFSKGIYDSKGITDASDEFNQTVYNAVRQMQAIKVDGIIYVAGYTRKMKKFPEDMNVPCVTAYAISPNREYPSVLIGDEKAAFEITEFMISKGWKKIGMIRAVPDSTHSIKRYAGYCRALEKYGIKIDESIVEDGKWDRESGYISAKKLIKKGVDSVFCANDLIACGVCDYLREIGIIPGKDIGVAGFDNQELSEYTYPKLTTVQIPLVEIGMKSAELIIKKINGEKLENDEYEVDCSLIKRETV